MKARVVLAVGVPLALLLSLVAWAFASPVGSSPDDDYHMTSIWCGQGFRDGLCEPGEAPDERRVPAILLEAPTCFAFKSEQSASCLLPPPDVLVNTNRGNFAGDYPPIYYGVMSVFASPDVDTAIIAIRIANALIFVGLGSALTMLLPVTLRVASVMPFAIASVPLGMFLVPSINPSSWAILSAAGLWIALVGFIKSAGAWRRWALAGLVVLFAVMGAGARSDAAVYAGLAVVLALLLTAERTRRWAFGAGLGGIVLVIAAISFLTSGQSSAVAAEETSPGGIGATLANLVLLPDLWAGSFGTWGLGWLDTAMPPIVWVGSMVAFAALVFSGLRRMSRRKALALALTFAALVVIPMYILYIGNLTVGAGVQPRYIYPLLIVLAGIAFWHRGSVRLWLSPTQLGVIAVLLAAANSVALHTNLRRYLTGTDVNGPDLDAGNEWWWSLAFGPNWVWISGSVAFTLAIFALAWGAARFSTARGAADRSAVIAE